MRSRDERPPIATAPQPAVKSSKSTESPSHQLPSTSELATLAALLGPRERPDQAVRDAMQWVLRCGEVLRRAAGMTTEELHEEFADADLFRSKVLDPLVESMKLDFAPKSPGSDSVRDYLGGKGVHLKTAKAVRENLRELFIASSQTSGGSQAEGVLKFKEYLKDAGVPSSDGAPRYAIDQEILDRLIRWKKRKKSGGGRRSRQKSPSI